MLLPGLGTLVRGAIVMIGFVAVVPIRANDVRSHPDPARSYADAVTRAYAMIDADDSVVAPGGASILLAHGARTPRAFVLFHGFTDSPRQFAALADSLYARGDNVFVPRLPHHALASRDVGQLGRLKAEELCALADQSVDIAAGLGDSVVVMGLSVGATMAAWTGEHRAEVKRAVMIAPALEFTHVPSMFERSIVNIGEHVPNLTRRDAPDPGRPDRDPGFATHGLAEVIRLGMIVRRDAERLPAPSADMLFLVNAHDHTVKIAPVLDLARLWNRRSAPVSVYELPDSLRLPHNIVDPIQPASRHAAVYPVLESLALGTQPPGWLRRR